MTNKEIMRFALNSHVIPGLRERGFTGKYPHFRREKGNAIDLLSFQTNAWGGSFTVELSAAFPGTGDPNYRLAPGETEQTMDVSAAVRRYRLKGMYNGWFHYWDLYRRRILFFKPEYMSVPKREAGTFVPAKGFQLFQKFDEAQALRVCKAVNEQLEEGYDWLVRLKAEHK